MINKPLTSFASGELSPWLDGRIDLEKYASGCKILENFLVTPYGGLRRRAGTEYIAAVRTETEAARLLPFRFSTTDTYMLVFSGGYIDIYDGGASPAAVDNLDVATDTGSDAYAAGDLFEIQYAQQNDVMYLVHPDYPVRKLTRTSATTFTIEDVDFEWWPQQERNTDTAITIVSDKCIGTDATLTGVGTNWTEDLVGSRFRLDFEREGDNFRVVYIGSGTNTSDELLVQGTWTAETTGTWTAGSLKIERYDETAASWTNIREEEPRTTNVAMSGFEEEIVRMRFTMTSAAGTNPGAFLATEGDAFGEVEITGHTDGQTLTADITHRLYPASAGTPDGTSGTTSLWSEGAFSADSGYARTAAFHEGRLVFGGTAKQAQTIWGSVSDDYENFRTGTDDDDSYRHILAAAEHNGIRWMVSERRLIIGTSGGEFVVGSSDDSVVITPSNVRARRHSNFGSDTIQALFANDSVIYAQRHGRKIREYGYSFERDRYQATDLTILAEHVSGTGIVELAYQQQRDSIIWAVTNEGELIGLTFERDQAVYGWHTHLTGASDTFESVETIYGEGEEDEVWVIVARTVNGSSQRYIERIEPNQYQTQESEDKDNYWYVDCGSKSTGTDLTTITLAHLPSTVVSIIADGVQTADVTTTAAGVATLPNSATADTIIAGLPMVSKVEPMPLDVQLPTGPARNREGRINRIGLSYWKSMGGEYGATADGAYSTLTLDSILYRTIDDSLDTSPDVKTGEVELEADFDFKVSPTVAVVTESVYPFALLSLIAKIEYFGDDI